MKLKVKRLSEHATLPTRNNPSDAGLDLYAIENVEIYPGQTAKIRTGIAVQLEPVYPEHFNSNGDYIGKIINKKYGLFIHDRSSLGSKGIHRFAGMIDFNYTGEVLVILHNENINPQNPFSRMVEQGKPYIIKKGDKIAQLVIQEIFTPEIVEVSELDLTDRGEKGFGSSDKKI